MLLLAARDVAPHDPERAREMAAIAAGIATVGGDSGVDVDPSALVPPAADRDPLPVRCADALLRGLAAVRRGDWGDAAARLRPAFATDPLDALPVDLLANLGVAALHLGDDEAVDRLHTALLTRARDAGATILVLYALTRRAFAGITTGRWTEAEADAAEALQLARVTGRPALAGLPLAWLALLATRRGDPGADERLRAAEDVLAAHPGGTLEPLARDVVAWTKATRIAAGPAPPRLFRGACGPRPAEHRRRGRRPRRAVAELEAFAVATGTAWAAAAAEHGRALLADDRAAEAHFVQRWPTTPARPAGSTAPAPSWRSASTCGGPVAASTPARTCARPWRSSRTSAPHRGPSGPARSCGHPARPRAAATTPRRPRSPRRSCRSPGSSPRGCPNREVAARLFVSPRTVEFHLRNVFTKLGVTARAELARLPLS